LRKGVSGPSWLAAPVAFDPVPAAIFVAPVAGNPFGMRTRRFNPAAWNPDVSAAIPAVIAADPDPSIVGTRAGVFGPVVGRADLNVNALGKSGRNRRETEENSRRNEKQFLHKEWVFLSRKLGCSCGWACQSGRTADGTRQQGNGLRRKMVSHRRIHRGLRGIKS
jgi:hypothetical protein